MTRTVGREHHRALELLERALGYTRGALATVGADRSGPTPCAGWSLADLLCHMDDGLDAFLEAAGGAVRVEVPRRPASDLEALQGKACHLTTATHTEDHEGRELKLLLSTLFDRGLALAMRPEVRELILVASPNEILERGIAVDRLESAHVVDSDTKRARALTAILSNRFFIKAVQTATGGAAFSRLGQAPVEDAPVRQDGVI